MKKWRKDFLSICRNKIYVLMLSLTAVFSYGFLVTHETVGIDDTPYAYYFEEGLNAIVGRWFLFLLNKVFHISDFSPFVTDLAGVLILMAAVTVWCTLFYSICGKKIPTWGYVFFSCIFLSCPLISEVYTYYLHNGISVGYLCTGISLCFFKELTEKAMEKEWRNILPAGVKTAVFLFIALGCYESFMVVWLTGVFLVLLTKMYMDDGTKLFIPLVCGALAAAAAILLRSIMIAGVIGIFGLGDMQDEAVRRSIAEMAGWLFEPGALAEFAMAVKRVYVMYFAFAYAYYPIKIFVSFSGFLLLFGVYCSIRRKNVWIAMSTFGVFVSCFLLVLVEGSVTLYRAAQFLPVVCGYGVLLAAYAVESLKSLRLQKQKTKAQDYMGRDGEREGAKESPEKRISLVHRICSGAAVLVLCAVLWNQCFEMNKWFYVDWLKYQSAIETAGQIVWELERNFDTSKPVVFTGTYKVPKSIIGDAYVAYNSKTFYKINRLTNIIDEHLLEKYYRGDYGVWVAQTPALSVLDWGVNAFGTDEELVRFFGMHGYSIRANTDGELFEAATLYSMDFPHFPDEGSIVDMGEYIIVHF